MRRAVITSFSYTNAGTVLALLVLLCGLSAKAEIVPADEEQLIKIALQQYLAPMRDRTFTLSRETMFYSRLYQSAEADEQQKVVKNRFRVESENDSELISRLFEKNKATATLSIGSAPNDGYVVDQDPNYSIYVAGQAPGFVQRTKSKCQAGVSRPVMDRKREQVLLYLQSGCNGEWEGYVVSYRRRKGSLTEIRRLKVASYSPPPTNQQTDRPPVADLTAAAITWRPNPVHVGDPVVFDHTVKNEGTTTVAGGTYFVDIYVDGKSVGADHGTSDLSPGKEIKYSMSPGYFHWKPAKPGRYHYRFVVDEKNTVPESSETNNVLEGDIEVLP